MDSVQIYHCFVCTDFCVLAFLTLPFAVAKESRRIGVARVSKRDTWVKYNSCSIFAYRKYTHESYQFVKFNLDLAQFVLFLWLLFRASRRSFLAEICSGQ